MKKNLGLLIIFFLLSLFYYVTGPGAIVGSNDGSHYALLRSAFENKKFELGKYISYTNYVSVSAYKNKFYSDRSPGLALVSSPLYLLGKSITGFLKLADDPQRFETTNINTSKELLYREFPVTSILILFLLISPAITGTLNVIFFWKISRLIGQNNFAINLATLTFAIGSLNWKYSTLYFSHSLSTLLILSLVYHVLSLSLKKSEPKWWIFIIIGVTAGFSILTEYLNVIYLLPIFVYCLYNFSKIVGTKLKLTKIVLTIIAFLIPVTTLLLYQWLLFENPFSTTYSHHYFYTWARTWQGFFSGNFKSGFIGQLFSQQRNGVFFLSPVLLLSLLGLFYVKRKSPQITILLCSLFILPVILFSFAYDWNGGGFDTRYILAAISFLFLPLSVLPLKNKTLLTIFLLLLIISIFNSLKLVLKTSLLGFGQDLNFYHLPYIFLAFSIILFFFSIFAISNKKFFIPFLAVILSIVLLRYDILNDWKVLPWKIIYKDNFNNGQFEKKAKIRKNIIRDDTVIFPINSGQTGHFILEFKFKKKPKFLILISNYTIGSKNSQIKVEAGTNLKKLKPVYFIKLADNKERSIKFFYDLTKLIVNKKIYIRQEFFVDNNFAVSPADSRLEKIVVVSIN